MPRAQKAIWFCFSLSFLPLLHNTETFITQQVLVDQRHSRFVRNVRVGRTHSEERRNLVRNLQRRIGKIRPVVRAAIHR